MKKIIIAALFVLTACGNAIAENDLKIGFVNARILLSQSPQVEAATAAMMERFSGKTQELKDLDDELKSLKENYKRNELVMTEDKLKELQAQYFAKANIFKQKEATLAQESKVMRDQEMAVIQKVVNDAITTIAKKENYDLILSEGVVFASDKPDITTTVLDEIKKAFKKK